MLLPMHDSGMTVNDPMCYFPIEGNPRPSQVTYQMIGVEKRITAGVAQQRRNIRALNIALLSTVFTLASCGDPIWLPRAHKIDVQQGNLVTTEQVDAIKTGMSREEVATLLGVPVSTSAFHTNRWDYTYTLTPAGHRSEAKRFTVFFADNVVSSTENNFSQESGEISQPRYWFLQPSKKPAPETDLPSSQTPSS